MSLSHAAILAPAPQVGRSLFFSVRDAAREVALLFVAFGKSLDAFEALLQRLTGQDDGVTDALFHISKPSTGAFLGCPPWRAGRLDLRGLGL